MELSIGLEKTQLHSNGHESIFAALWTALCLSFLESLAGSLIALAVYLIECLSTHDVRQPSITSSVMGIYEIIFVARIVYGFLPATAFCLFFCSLAGRMWSWTMLGIYNWGSIILMCIVWDKSLELMSRLKHVEHPLFENFMYIILGVSFFSPYILSKLKIPGTILPSLLRGRDVPGVSKI